MNQHNSFGIDVKFFSGPLKGREKAEQLNLIYVIEGSAKLRMNDESFVMKQDDMILVNVNEEFSWSNRSDAMVCVVEMDLSILLGQQELHLLTFVCNTVAEPDKDYRRLRQVMDRILKEYSLDMHRDNYKKKGLLYQLLDLLLNGYVASSQTKMEVLSQDEQFQSVVDYINNHYWHHLSLEEVAGQVYMSVSAFSRYFKKMAGINFHEYLNNLRLSKAKDELMRTDKSLAKIADEHGFTNPSMFSKAFKSAYHMSPRAFKQSNTELALVNSKEDVGYDLQQETLRKAMRDRIAQRIETDVFKRRIQVSVDHVEVNHIVWTDVINVGHATELLSARMQKQVLILREDMGFHYVRIINIFSWDMKLRKDTQDWNLNFEFVDNVLDFVVTNRLHPMIDFGDKPMRVLQNIQKLLFYEKQTPIFNTLEEFEYLLQQFMEHIIRRYGKAEVNQWYFELWNTVRDGEDMNWSKYNYFQVFAAAHRIIKKQAAYALIGGCGFELGGRHQEYLQNWCKSGVLPDFISIVAFPYKRKLPGFDLKEGGSERISDFHFMKNALRDFKQQMAAAGMEGIPIWVTEWNLSMSDRNYYNDSCGKAAQLLAVMTDITDEIDLGAYLYASDLTNRFYGSLPPFFGGIGLLSKEDIRKPVCFALTFWEKLLKYRVQVGDGYIITTDRMGNYAILLFNYKKFNYSYYEIPEGSLPLEELSKIYVDNYDEEYEVTLEAVEDGTYTVRSYRVNENHANAIAEWQRLAGNRELDLRDQEYLKRICVPQIIVTEELAERGKLTFSKILKAHEVCLVEIYRQ